MRTIADGRYHRFLTGEVYKDHLFVDTCDELNKLNDAIAALTARCEAAEAVCNAFDGNTAWDVETAMAAWHRIKDGRCWRADPVTPGRFIEDGKNGK